MNLFGFFLLKVVSCAIVSVSDPSLGIRNAIAKLNASDVLQLGPGVFAGEKNCDLRLGPLDDISIVGAGRGRTVIDCLGSRKRCLTIYGARRTVVSGIHFRNGEATVHESSAKSERPVLHMERQKPSKQLPARRTQSRIPKKTIIAVIIVSIDEQGDIVQENVNRRGAQSFWDTYMKQENAQKRTAQSKECMDCASRPVPGVQTAEIGGCILIEGSSGIFSPIRFWGNFFFYRFLIASEIPNQ